MGSGRKFLIAQVTESSNLITDGFNINIFQFIHEKLILLLQFISDTFTHLTQKIAEINPAVFLEVIKQKLVLFLQYIKHILIYLSEKLDEILRPETRSKVIHYWLPRLLLVVIVACAVCLVLYALFKVLPAICMGVRSCCQYFCQFCRRAFGAVSWCCSHVFNAVCLCFGCYFQDGGETVGKIMKAPGRGGELMLRAAFEAGPRIYFQGLRAGEALVSNLA